jgi:hypothetical protein
MRKIFLCLQPLESNTAGTAAQRGWPSRVSFLQRSDHAMAGPEPPDAAAECYNYLPSQWRRPRSL